jgi:hypothetical protein
MPRLIKFVIPFALSVLFFTLPASAANYALLVGIEEYQDHEHINPFGAAVADAKGVAKALQEAAAFPASNTRVLASDGVAKPTRANIVSALEDIARKVKPEDVVMVMFICHGTEIDKSTYLLPWDSNGANSESLKATALPAATLRAVLSKMRPGALVVVFDMWRDAPRKDGHEIPPQHAEQSTSKRVDVATGCQRRGSDAHVLCVQSR